MAKKKHTMDLQDLARILQAATDKVKGQPKTVDTTQAFVGGREQRYPGKLESREWTGAQRIRPQATNILDAMFTDREIDYIPSARDDFRGMIPTEGGWHEATGEGGGFMPDDLESSFPSDRPFPTLHAPSSYLDALDASDNWQSQEYLQRQAEARAATAPGQLGEMFADPETRGERVQRLPGYLQTKKQMGYMEAGEEMQRGGIDVVGRTQEQRQMDSGIREIDPDQLKEQNLATQRQQRTARDKTLGTEFNRISMEYQNLGAEINRTTDAKERQQMISQRNALIERGQSMVQQLQIPVGRPGNRKGEFPFVEPVRKGDLAKAQSEQQKKKLEQGLAKGMGKGMGAIGLKRGELFRGTGYATTGAINGVMRALAGIFILFVFIGVFYMVFGPIYDSLIFNFTNIVSADGDPTLGGKDIPTLFDNVAKVILVWVPLIVFAGALYKLTALVFEREGGTRSTEETEWDMLGSIEDSSDLDMGSDPGVFEAYGGGY